MSWTVGGHDYTYRMRAPIANAGPAVDCKPTLRIPEVLLRALDRITAGKVHVTASDGTTELPCALNEGANTITVGLAGLAQGVTELQAFFGDTDAPLPDPIPVVSGSVLDKEFERGTASATVADGVLEKYMYGGGDASGVAKTYDHTHARTGSSMEVKVVGSASANYNGVVETASAGLNGTTGEIQFDFYHVDTTHGKRIWDNNATIGDCPFYLHWATDGKIYAYTNRTKTGYTPGGETQVGNYIAGWATYRIVFNFPTRTYQLSFRGADSEEWTQLKAVGASDYDIPFFSDNSNATATSGTRFEIDGNGQAFWLDRIRWSNAGIADITWDTTRAQVFEFNDCQTAADGDVERFVWGADTHATCLDSGAADTYMGGDATHKAGILSTGQKFHYLFKPEDYVLGKGTISAAKLYLNCESNAQVVESLTLKAHRLLNTGVGGSNSLVTAVGTGWALQPAFGYPTWNKRFQAPVHGVTPDWEAPGVVGASEVDLSDVAAPSLVLAPGFTVGFKSIDLPPGWLEDWQGDDYSSGILIKDSTDSAGANHRAVAITGWSQAACPVLVVTYSAMDDAQLSARKITSSSHYGVTQATQDRHAQLGNSQGFRVVGYTNTNHYYNVLYVDRVSGRLSRTAPSFGPPGNRFYNSCPTYGLSYDYTEDRFWLAGSVAGSAAFVVAYSIPYSPTGWSWCSLTPYSAEKSSISPVNGVCHCLFEDNSTGACYATYTRTTDTWSSSALVVTRTPGGTPGTLASDVNPGDVMDGAGVISVTGGTTAYSAFGSLVIGDEYFWYTGKTSSTFTGVTRGAFASTPAMHSIGNNVLQDRLDQSYTAISHDEANGCMHVCGTNNGKSSQLGRPSYLYAWYLRHYYAEAANVWHNSADEVVTLPVDNRTDDICSPPGRVTYETGIVCLADSGDVLVANTCLDDPTSWWAANYKNAWVARLPFGGAWEHIDLSNNMQEMSFVDARGGHVKLSGLSTADLAQVQVQQSDDSGHSWRMDRTLAAHTFAAQDPTIPMWWSSCSERGDPTGLVYAAHFAWHGALFVDEVILAVINPMAAMSRNFLLG